jgi:hypothetical protein
MAPDKKQIKKDYMRQKYLEDPEKYRNKSKNWRLKNRDRHLAYMKEWHLRNPKERKERIVDLDVMQRQKLRRKEYIREYNKKYYMENKEKEKLRRKKWAMENPEWAKEHRLKTFEKRYEYNKLWNLNNRDRLNLRNRKLRISTPERHISSILRSRTRSILRTKGFKTNSSFKEYIGCTVKQLVAHIEAKFLPGMSWENQGKWHIDHIVPLNSAKSVEEVFKLSNYKNLQPLWAKDNIAKSAKMPNNKEGLFVELGINNLKKEEP